MTNRELIYESINKIEEIIEDSILIPDLAKSFGFSPYYYSKIFKAITGISPKSYIHGRKLMLSALDLVQGDLKVIDIAYKYGFASHEVYTRAFKKTFNLSPLQVKKNKKIPTALGMKKLTPERIRQMNHLLNTAPELISKDAIKLVGLSFYYDLQEKNDLSNSWSHLMTSLEKVKHKIEPHRFYQMQYWFPDQDSEMPYFYIAVEVKAFEDIPIQLTAKLIPKQQYLKFYHRGLANQVGYTYQYIYNDYLPDTRYQLPHCYNFEYYGEQHLGPYDENSISEIYIPVLQSSLE